MHPATRWAFSAGVGIKRVGGTRVEHGRRITRGSMLSVGAGQYNIVRQSRGCRCAADQIVDTFCIHKNGR